MKIYLAGNTPNRVQEERSRHENGYYKYRLLSYFFYTIDSSMKGVFNYWNLL